MEEVNEKVRQSFSVERLPQPEEKKGLRGDYGNLSLLIFLYILQGLPFGIMGVIPMMLATNGVSYEKQALFTFARYPYVFKLLWAPIVDTIYSKRFGRRKSWLIPAQYLIGGTMILTSMHINELMGDKNRSPNIYLLTLSMFFITFFAATQDVAVDAWSLTLLAKRNVHYASSCNVAGLVFGIFLSSTVFLALESSHFCNKFRNVPQTTGIITLSEFLFGIGIVFMVATTCVWMFKKETHSEKTEDEIEIKGIWESYKILYKIVKLRPVQWIATIHLTQQIGPAAVSNVGPLKFIQYGFKRENLSMLVAPIGLLNIVLPFFIVKTARNNPLDHYWKSSFLTQITGCSIVALVYWIQTMHNSNTEFPIYFYVIFFICLAVYDVLRYASLMTLWTFMIRVVDPNVGGTYMTLISTFFNIGIKWTATLSVYLVDVFTIKLNTDNESLALNVTHRSMNATNNPEIRIAAKPTTIDGFYVESVVCFVLGVIWLFCYKPVLTRIQQWPESDWRCTQEEKGTKL